MNARQRIDLWLWRARIMKTRSAATQLAGAGGVRLIRGDQGRRLERASAEVEAGDAIVFAGGAGLRAIRILALPLRRGPAAEARALYCELDADGLA